jgi:hypothetical protein
MLMEELVDSGTQETMTVSTTRSVFIFLFACTLGQWKTGRTCFGVGRVFAGGGKNILVAPGWHQDCALEKISIRIAEIIHRAS